MNSSSSGGSLLAVDKTSAAEGKEHSCEKSRFPHEEQVLSCAYEEGDVPLPVVSEKSHIPDCLPQSPFGTQRTTNSFSARGSFLSFITQRGIKFLQSMQRRTVQEAKAASVSKQAHSSEHGLRKTYCLPASKKKEQNEDLLPP